MTTWLIDLLYLGLLYSKHYCIQLIMKGIQIYLGSLLACLVLIITGTHSQNISDICIECICETGCNITESFWKDGGELRLPEDKNLSSTPAFKNCRENSECSTKTIQQYMIRYAWDCDNDGEINCIDHLSIHKLGPYGCDLKPVTPDFLAQVQKCLQRGKTSQVNLGVSSAIMWQLELWFAPYLYTIILFSMSSISNN